MEVVASQVSRIESTAKEQSRNKRLLGVSKMRSGSDTHSLFATNFLRYQ